MHNPAEAFGVVLEEVVGALAPRRILLALDEFSTLNEWLSSPETSASETNLAFGYLSNTLQSMKNLTLIFTGTYMLLEMMRVRAFDLAKICVPHMVGFLDGQSARQLVERPAKRDLNTPDKGWLEYDPRAVDRIIYLTNRHPYLIQYFCMQIVDRMNSLKHSTVNLNDVESVQNEIVLRPMHATPMLTLWQEFSDRQHAVLAVIAALVGESSEKGVEVGPILRIVSERIPGMSESDVMSVTSTHRYLHLLFEESFAANNQSIPEELKVFFGEPGLRGQMRRNKAVRHIEAIRNGKFAAHGAIVAALLFCLCFGRHGHPRDGMLE